MVVAGINAEQAGATHECHQRIRVVYVTILLSQGNCSVISELHDVLVLLACWCSAPMLHQIPMGAPVLQLTCYLPVLQGALHESPCVVVQALQVTSITFPVSRCLHG